MPSDKDIILQPIISEKSVRLKEENKYVFKVAWEANCSEIGKAIEEKFLGKIFGYKIIRETVTQLFGEEKTIFKGVALVKLFGNETRMTSFITDEHDDGSYTVFIPSGPAPTAGFVYHVTKKQVEIVDVPVEQALRTILSLGSGSKKLLSDSFKTLD